MCWATARGDLQLVLLALTGRPVQLRLAADARRMSAARCAPPLLARLVAIPLALLALLIAGILSIAIVLGAAPQPGCGSEAVGSIDSRQVPARYVPLYTGAAARFKLGARGPSILAAINQIESGFGANTGPSSAGAQGPMQFLPSTFAAYGVDGDGDGAVEIESTADSIYAAANYLHASGAPEDWHAAIYAYNHAEWYVADVEATARRFAAAGSTVPAEPCLPAAPAGPIPDIAVRLFAPRAFKPLPTKLWIGTGAPQVVDARIWPDAVWLLTAFELRATAARESGHSTHGDGTAIDVVPASGRPWEQTARAAAEALGWTEACGASGTAPACPLKAAIQFVGYNGYPSHGDPAHAGTNAHLHVSWKSSDYGCPGLCPPREWVEVFP